MTDRQPLTENQAQLLDFMLRHLREHQRYPTVVESAEELGVTHNAAAERFRALAKKGWIRLGGGRSRGCEIVGLQMTVSLPETPCTDVQLPGRKSA